MPLPWVSLLCKISRIGQFFLHFSDDAFIDCCYFVDFCSNFITVFCSLYLRKIVFEPEPESSLCYSGVFFKLSSWWYLAGRQLSFPSLLTHLLTHRFMRDRVSVCVVHRQREIRVEMLIIKN